MGSLMPSLKKCFFCFFDKKLLKEATLHPLPCAVSASVIWVICVFVVYRGSFSSVGGWDMICSRSVSILTSVLAISILQFPHLSWMRLSSLSDIKCWCAFETFPFFFFFLEHFNQLYPTFANIPPSVFLDSPNIPSNAEQMLGMLWWMSGAVSIQYI